MNRGGRGGAEDKNARENLRVLRLSAVKTKTLKNGRFSLILQENGRFYCQLITSC